MRPWDATRRRARMGSYVENRLDKGGAKLAALDDLGAQQVHLCAHRTVWMLDHRLAVESLPFPSVRPDAGQRTGWSACRLRVWSGPPLTLYRASTSCMMRSRLSGSCAFHVRYDGRSARRTSSPGSPTWTAMSGGAVGCDAANRTDTG